MVCGEPGVECLVGRVNAECCKTQLFWVAMSSLARTWLWGQSFSERLKMPKMPQSQSDSQFCLSDFFYLFYKAEVSHFVGTQIFILTFCNKGQLYSFYICWDTENSLKRSDFKPFLLYYYFWCDYALNPTAPYCRILQQYKTNRKWVSYWLRRFFAVLWQTGG